MTDTDSRNSLRRAIAPLDNNERLALATWLTAKANSKFQYLAELPDWEKLSSKLADVCELSAILLPAAKIFFAIELLEAQCDRDEFEEDDGELWGPREDPSITQAIDEVNTYTRTLAGEERDSHYYQPPFSVPG